MLGVGFGERRGRWGRLFWGLGRGPMGPYGKGSPARGPRPKQRKTVDQDDAKIAWMSLGPRNRLAPSEEGSCQRSFGFTSVAASFDRRASTEGSSDTAVSWASAPPCEFGPRCFLPEAVFKRASNGEYVRAADFRGLGGDELVGPYGARVLVMRAGAEGGGSGEGGGTQ